MYGIYIDKNLFNVMQKSVSVCTCLPIIVL